MSNTHYQMPAQPQPPKKKVPMALKVTAGIAGGIVLLGIFGSALSDDQPEAAAVKAGLLSRVERGRPGVTAVYRGSLPGSVTAPLHGGIPHTTHGGYVPTTPAGESHGVGNPTSKPLHGGYVPTSHGGDGVAATSNHVGTEPYGCRSPRGEEKTRSNEKAGDQPSRPSGSTSVHGFDETTGELTDPQLLVDSIRQRQADLSEKPDHLDDHQWLFYNPNAKKAS